MDLISVIVPVYKVEPYLDRCVASIVGQTYRNLEIILVDDGSPDRCPEMCDLWAQKDARIKVIHKKNGGLSDARNAGLQAAKGDYIGFVDSDDWIERCFFEQLLQAAIKNGADISACDLRIVCEDEKTGPATNTRPLVKTMTPEEAMRDLVQGKGFRAIVWNKLYSKTVLSNELFAVDKLHEDEFFTYRICDKAATIAYIDAPLYNYFQRTGSIMHTSSSAHIDVLDAYLERMKLFKIKYPSLYAIDKIGVCITCINLYCESLSNDAYSAKADRKRIKEKRTQLSFSTNDFAEYSLKQIGFIVFSHPLLIDFFCRIRARRRRRNG